MCYGIFSCNFSANEENICVILSKCGVLNRVSENNNAEKKKKSIMRQQSFLTQNEIHLMKNEKKKNVTLKSRR